MAVCVVNLAQLDPESNGGLSRVAREISRLLLDIAEERSSFYPVFAVQNCFAPYFAEWLNRKPIVIPLDPLFPQRPLLRGLNPDLILSPLFGVDPFDQIEEFRGVRHIAVMPDALALDMPELFSAKIRARRQLAYQRLKNSYRIITLSEYARSRLLYHLQLPQESIVAIPLGADAVSAPQSIPVPDNIGKPYLFYPANTWRHKRHDLLLATFRQVLQTRPEMHLVLSGGRTEEFGVDLPTLIAAHQIPADRVHDLGYVADEQMPALYTNAEALLFTSQHEGFGMPILEAMQFGCPVICADVTSIPEVAGDAALYVNGNDPWEWARTLLEDLPQQRAALIERGFKRAAQFTWKAAREHYRQFLLDSVPDIVGEAAIPTVPTVKLPLALEELEASFPLFRAGEAPIELDMHLRYMDMLIHQENQFVLGRIPLLGPFIRAMIRLRNIGRFWRSSSIVAAELVRRQKALAAEIQTSPTTDQHPKTTRITY